MWDVYAYSHKCAAAECKSVLRNIVDPNTGVAVSVMADSDISAHSLLAADTITALMSSHGSDPLAAVCMANEQLAATGATASACAVLSRGTALSWATVGNVRAYFFASGALACFSADDTPSYSAYARGDYPYADIRFKPELDKLTACLGMSSCAPHTQSISVNKGDALLICSDGFWRFIFETEMELDLIKANSVDDWVRRMMLRIINRSMLDGDSISVTAAIFR